MNTNSEDRLIRRMENPKARKAMKKFTLRTALVFTLAFVLLAAIAVAAANWGAKQFLSYEDDEGTTHLNEELAGYIQPVGQKVVGDALTIDVIDSIYDGESAVLAWTTQNTLADRTVYLLCETLTVDGARLSQAHMQNVDELFLSPGEVGSNGISGIVQRTGGAPALDTCQVEMKYSVLVPKGEVVELRMPDDADDQDEKAFFEEIDRLNAEGKVVVDAVGSVLFPSDYFYDAEHMRTYDVVSAGVMDLIDEVSISFTLQKNAQMQSAFKAGETRTFEFADYSLRVLRADLSPNLVKIDMEVVFPNKETVEKYRPYFFSHKEQTTGWWGYEFLDEAGDQRWFHNGGGTGEDAPVEGDDGTWVWPMHWSMTDIQKTPKSITIMPTRSADFSKYEATQCLDEAATITFS